MRTNTRNWLMWYKKQMGWEGVRIDAIKHFPTYIVEDFLWNLQHGNGWANGTDDMYAVGEWVGGASELDQWCNDVQNRAGTFDFSLRNALLVLFKVMEHLIWDRFPITSSLIDKEQSHL